MGTYAHYRLWIGFWTNDLDEVFDELSPGFGTLLEEVEDSFGEGVTREEINIQSFGMHGENIGYGVLVKDLEWITTEERPEVVDMSLYYDLERQCRVIEGILKRLGLPEKVPVRIYNHIDLGG